MSSSTLPCPQSLEKPVPASTPGDPPNQSSSRPPGPHLSPLSVVVTIGCVYGNRSDVNKNIEKVSYL